jgi:hypothetical protein
MTADGGLPWRHPPAWPIRVALARDPARIIAWLGVRLIVGEIGLIVGLQTPGSIGTAVTIAAVAVLGYVVLLSVHALSLRVDLHPGEIHVRSFVVRRRYRLSPEPISQMQVRARAGFFGTQIGGFGIELGLGRITTEESVEVLRLSPVASVIIVPCVGTRLAVAPLSERALVRAVRAALSADQPSMDPRSSR